MLSFLSTFSTSFLLAILIWPFLAFALTLPILIMQYRRFNKIVFSRAILTYAFILYALALVSFTLYPMPDNPTAFCDNYHLLPQLYPLQFISDIQADGLRALLQIAMNIIFFVPFGFFARFLFGWRWLTTLLASLILSLGIETAQLTGAFGLYPCSYRLFDVDDLLVNTFGGLVGYLCALAIPKREFTYAKKNEVVKQPGLLRMSVALIIDQTVVVFANIFIIVFVYFVFGNDTAFAARDFMYILILLTVHGFIPYLLRGWSLGSRMVRFNHDDKERSFWRRLLFYVLRTAYLWLLFLSGQTLLVFLAIAVTIFVWVRWKRLPYQFF